MMLDLEHHPLVGLVNTVLCFAITPSKPALSKRRNQSRAISGGDRAQRQYEQVEVERTPTSVEPFSSRGPLRQEFERCDGVSGGFQKRRNLTQEAMKAPRPGGVILSTTSIDAYEPGQELVGYAATKAAIVNLTKSTAKLAMQ
jgi:NAD(P)-dependent dehydrogenase (short-subunit alcohol dehydrogenase family)